MATRRSARLSGDSEEFVVAGKQDTSYKQLDAIAKKKQAEMAGAALFTGLTFLAVYWLFGMMDFETVESKRGSPYHSKMSTGVVWPLHVTIDVGHWLFHNTGWLLNEINIFASLWEHIWA